MSMLVEQQTVGIRPKCVNPGRMRKEAFPMCYCTFVLVHDANGMKKDQIF